MTQPPYRSAIIGGGPAQAGFQPIIPGSGSQSSIGGAVAAGHQLSSGGLGGSGLGHANFSPYPYNMGAHPHSHQN